MLSTKPDRDMDTGRFDGTRARRSVEESLTALGLDRVQMLHLHDPEHALDLTFFTNRRGASGYQASTDQGLPVRCGSQP